MIAHVVLLTPRADLSPADRAHAIRTLASAASNAPDILRYRIGRRVRHGLPGYEQHMQQNYELALMMEFEDLDALRRYLTAPAHGALGHLFLAATSAALAYDYEIVDGVDGAALWGHTE